MIVLHFFKRWTLGFRYVSFRYHWRIVLCCGFFSIVVIGYKHGR